MAEAPRSPVGNTVTMDVVDLHSSSNNSNNTTAARDLAAIDAGAALDLQCMGHLLKLPDLSSSSSESDEEMLTSAITLAVATGGTRIVSTRPTSPPPNCAICLGRCKNKCFTDSCRHQFCFKCLCEWSKVKPECPLCKQTFKSIIHNVKSIDQFEEYHVQPPSVQIPHPLEVTYRQSPYILDVLNNPQLEVSLQGLRTVRTILYPSSSSAGGGAAPPNGNNPGNIQNQFINRSELIDMYRQEFPDTIASSGTLSQLWRRYVYDRKLYALPVCDITGRFRESSARFYRDNPAQIHRLMPWINRDIVCLLRNTEHDVSFVLERINEWMIMANILSPLFRRRLQPILGTKTAHFIHELNNFARSPYDMIGYDRAVQYSPQNTEEIVIEFSTSSSSADSSDEEPVNVVDADNDGTAAASNVSTIVSEVNAGGGNTVTERRRPSHRSRNAAQTSTSSNTASRSREYRMQSRAPMVNLLSFTISTTSEGVEAPGVTVAVNGRGSQSAAINLTTHNRAPSDVIIDLDDLDADVNPNIYTNNYTTGDGNNSTTAATTANAAPSSSTTTTTTTTAGTIPSTSAQHTAPTVTENIELSSTSSDECEFVLERKPPHLRTPEMVSLNSESDSDVVFVNENCAQMRYSTTTEDEETKAKHATSNAKHQRTLKHEVAQSADGSDPDYEYNVGASTSTGLRSSGRRGRRQKSLSMEKKKLRKRTLRSSKDSGLEKSKRRKSNTTAKSSHKAATTFSPFSSNKSSEMSFFTSSESEEEKLRPAADKRFKRLKRKTGGDSRVTRSTNEGTKDKTMGSSRSTKRKHSAERSGNVDRKLSKSIQFNEEKNKNKTENTDDDDSDFSSTEDAYLSLNKLRTRLKALQNKETGEHEEQSAIEQQHEADETTNSVATAVSEQAVEEESHVNKNTSLTCQLKREDIQTQQSSEDDESRPHEQHVTAVNDENNVNNCTASNNTINTENGATTEEPTTTAAADSTTTMTTNSSMFPTEPMFANLQQQEQQQPQHLDNSTFPSTVHIDVKVRSNSRTSRSSGYTTTTNTTTTTTDFTSSTSSSSSSSSDDSDSDDGGKKRGVAKNSASSNYDFSTHKTEAEDFDTTDALAHTSGSAAAGRGGGGDNIHFDPLIGANAAPLYYFNTNVTSPSNDTQEAATNEAAAALADFANSSFRLQLGNAELIQLANMPIFSSESEDNNIADVRNNDDDDDM